MRKANKGEWSEFYAFLKILFDHKLFSADETLTIIPESFLNVLNVIRVEETSTFKFVISESEQVINVFRNEEFLISVPALNIGSKLSNILHSIKYGGTRTGSFSLPEAESLMGDLRCTKIKAASVDKADILVTVEDVKSATIQQRGFSIKSQLGAASTLLNASRATNFEYKITECEAPIPKIKTPRIDLEQILSSNNFLEFVGLDNKTFEQNLKYVDSHMPYLLSQILLQYYLGYDPDVKILTQFLSEKDPLKMNDYGFYRHKIEELLISIALGMQPDTKWQGASSATGGYIIIKDNGELACYHIYERDRFKRYLYENTRLETPSRTRHKFGNVYLKAGQPHLKLNLQIRFKQPNDRPDYKRAKKPTNG